MFGPMHIIRWRHNCAKRCQLNVIAGSEEDAMKKLTEMLETQTPPCQQ